MPGVGWPSPPAEGRGPKPQQVQGVAQGQAELWGRLGASGEAGMGPGVPWSVGTAESSSPP